MPNQDGTLTIGDRNPSGYYEIADTSWDHNGILRVTVRELMGGRRELSSAEIKAMRRLARRALTHPEKTRSSRIIRTFFAEGCMYVTFAVSRLAP